MIPWLVGRLTTAIFAAALIYALVPPFLQGFDTMVEQATGIAPAPPPQDPFVESLVAVFHASAPSRR